MTYPDCASSIATEQPETVEIEGFSGKLIAAHNLLPAVPQAIYLLELPNGVPLVVSFVAIPDALVRASCQKLESDNVDVVTNFTSRFTYEGLKRKVLEYSKETPVHASSPIDGLKLKLHIEELWEEGDISGLTNPYVGSKNYGGGPRPGTGVGRPKKE